MMSLAVWARFTAAMGFVTLCMFAVLGAGRVAERLLGVSLSTGLLVGIVVAAFLVFATATAERLAE